MLSADLQVPKARVAVVIGKKGETRRLLEKKMGVRLEVTSEGEVTIISDDAVKNFVAARVVKAIARGFNPKIALDLLDDEYTLEVVNMKEFSGRSLNKFHRIKSRVIGTEGRAWKLLETLTNTDISVYGKTVAIIGNLDHAFIAKQAVEKLLSGSVHGKVYEFVERQMKRLHQQESIELYTAREKV